MKAIQRNISLMSEIIYSVMKISIRYQFLQLGAQPYQASMASSLIEWGVFLVSINVSVKVVKLFKK